MDRFRGLVFEGAVRHSPLAARSARYASAVQSRIDFDDAVDVPPDQLQLLERLFELADLDLSQYRMRPLLRRLPACLRALRTTSCERAAAAAAEDPHLLRAAMNALVVGVTSFFRDPIVFDNLQSHAIPAIVTAKPMRIWSVACSTGAELYSMAMMLDSLGLLDGATLLGTDCRTSAIESARRGFFADDSMGGLDDQSRRRWFVRQTGGWRVNARLSAAVKWATNDVLADRPTDDGWDVVLCRNLAIYLTHSSANTLWATLTDALVPGGFLVVGKAERPRPVSLRRVHSCIFRKQGLN